MHDPSVVSLDGATEIVRRRHADGIGRRGWTGAPFLILIAKFVVIFVVGLFSQSVFVGHV